MIGFPKTISCHVKNMFSAVHIYVGTKYFNINFLEHTNIFRPTNISDRNHQQYLGLARAVDWDWGADSPHRVEADQWVWPVSPQWGGVPGAAQEANTVVSPVTPTSWWCWVARGEAWASSWILKGWPAQPGVTSWSQTPTTRMSRCSPALVSWSAGGAREEGCRDSFKDQRGSLLQG